MAELADLAAVLAASGNNSSQTKALMGAMSPQPNSMETGLALEATRNPFAMPYYQVARNERMLGRAMSPEAMQAIQASQQRDYELQKLEAIAGPLATIAGHSPSTIQGTMQTFGVPMDNRLFELEQILSALETRAGAASELGSATQSAAAGGGDFNDIFEQLDFGRIGRTTPTSVQSAAAGKTPPKYDGPTVRYDAYDNGMNISLSDVPVGSGMTVEGARAAMGLGNASTPGTASVIDNGDGSDASIPVPPEVIARVNRITATQGYTPRGDIQANGTDSRGEPIFIQRVVRGGRDDVIMTTRNDAGQWVSMPLSRMQGG